MGRSRSRSRSRERDRRDRRDRSRSRERSRRDRSGSRERRDDRRRDDRDRRDRRDRSRSRERSRRDRSVSRERRDDRDRERGRDRDRERERERSPRPPREETRACFKCNETGHLARDCPKAGPGDSRLCHKCNETGHIARDCPKAGSGDTRLCHKCGKPGHIARDCTGKRSTADEEVNMEYGRPATGANADESDDEPVEKAKPNFEKSGKLIEETNTFKGVVLKYSEPEEARKPKLHWRLYPFKGEEALPVLHIHRQSAYLLGRERRVADIPLDHPSCSQQHAVIQYRLVEYEKDDGSTGRRIRPYVIDLGSSNGTLLNGTRIEPQRYVELKPQDCLKFGFSSREYVLMYGEMEAGAEANA